MRTNATTRGWLLTILLVLMIATLAQAQPAKHQRDAIDPDAYGLTATPETATPQRAEPNFQGGPTKPAPAPPPATTISLAPGAWTINWPADGESFGQPTHPSGLTGMAGWVFNWPEDFDCNPDPVYVDPCAVHYVWQNVAMNISGKSTISFTAQNVVVDGQPVMDGALTPDNNCSPSSTVRIMLFRKGINWNNEFDRWWSHVPMDLTKFDAETLVASLTDLSNWSSVYGKSANASSAATKGYQATLANLGQVALTFGGGCFFGHGDAIVVGTGHARFILTGLAVQ